MLQLRKSTHSGSRLRVGLAALSLGSLLIGCLPGGPGFLKQEGSSADAASAAIKAPVQQDAGGVLTAQVSASSSFSQTVQASASNSDIAKATVTFPPGALAVSNAITIQQGATLASTSLATQLGLDPANSLSPGGAAVVVSPSVLVDAATPFTIALPLSGSSSLLDQDTSLIVVVYKTWNAATGSVSIGLIPNADLVITADTVRITTLHFGQFQVAYAAKVVSAAVNVPSTTPPLTQAAAQALTAISWQSVAASFATSSRTLTVTSQVTGFGDLTSCSIVVSKSTTAPFDFTAAFGTSPSGTVNLGALVAGNYQTQVACTETSGRTSASPWSAAFAIAATAPNSAAPSTPAPAVAKPAQLALTSVAPGNQTMGNSLATSAYANFNVPIKPGISSDLQLHVAPGGLWSPAAPNAVVSQWPNVEALLTWSTSSVEATPNGPLPLLSTIVAQFNAPVTAVNGTSLGSIPSWAFQTADGSWGHTVDSATLPLTPISGFFFTAVGPSGDAVAFVYGSGQPFDAFYIHPGGGWDSAKQVDAGVTGTNVQNVQAVIDRSGNVTIVWTQMDPSTYYPTLYAIRRTVALGAWDAAPTVLDRVNGSPPLSNVAVGVTSSGTVRVVWFNDATKLAYTRENINGTWDADKTSLFAAPATDVAASSGNSAFAQNDADDFVYAYVDASSYVYLCSRLNHGAAVTNCNQVDSGATAIQAVVSPAGNGYVNYSKSAAAPTIVTEYTNISSGSAAWHQTTAANPGDAATISYMTTALAGAQPYVAWYDSVAGVQVAHWADSGTAWATPLVLADTTNQAYSLALATDPVGDAVALWSTQVSSNFNYYAEYLPGGITQAQLPGSTSIYSNSNNIYDIGLTMDASGNAMIVGYGNVAGGTSVFAAREARALYPFAPLTAIDSVLTTFKPWPIFGISTMPNVDSAGRVRFVYSTNDQVGGVTTPLLHIEQFE